MADKSSQLILNALSLAATQPAGLPLLASRASGGLFPSTSVGKQSAQRCISDGYVRLLEPSSHAAKKPASETYSITEKGLSFLAEQSSPRQVLEDLVRALEMRQVQMADLLQVAGQMRAELLQLKASTERVLQQVPRTESFTASIPAPAGEPWSQRPYGDQNGRSAGNAESVAALHREILSNLSRWDASGATEDYPLAELFRHLQASIPGLTIGRFHDALRDLHDADRLYLHPWTGPLYDLPEPAFALLSGHLIAYYASGRSGPEVLTNETAIEDTGTATLLRFPAR